MLRRSARIAANTVRRSARIAAIKAKREASQPEPLRQPSKQPTGQKATKKPNRNTQRDSKAEASRQPLAGSKRKRTASEDVETRTAKKGAPSPDYQGVANLSTATGGFENLSEDESEFLKRLFLVILARRDVRENRAAQEECSNDLRDLRWALNFNRPRLAHVPLSDEYHAVREEIRADMTRLEGHLQRREVLQEELGQAHRVFREELKATKDSLRGFSIEIPLPCLKENIGFCETFERCRSLEKALMEIELELMEVEQDQSSCREKYRKYGHQKLAKVLRRAEMLSAQEAETFVDNTKISKEDVLREAAELARRRYELKHDLRNTRVDLKWRNEILAQRAEPAMVDAGILETMDLEDCDPRPEPECNVYSPGRTMVDESPRARSSDGMTIMDVGSHNSETGERPSEKKRRILDEMIKAQFELIDARKEHNEGARMLTEDEMAALPQPVSEQRLAVALVQKLSRWQGRGSRPKKITGRFAKWHGMKGSPTDSPLTRRRISKIVKTTGMTTRNMLAER